MARTLMARLPRLFRTSSWVPWKKKHSCRFGIIRMIFIFILKMVYCVYSLESPRWGDSNENTQHTFILEKIEKISILSLLTWRCKKPSLAQTTPVSNIFSWSHRCSSHSSSTVLFFHYSNVLFLLWFTIIVSWPPNSLTICTLFRKVSRSSGKKRLTTLRFAFLILYYMPSILVPLLIWCLEQDCGMRLHRFLCPELQSFFKVKVTLTSNVVFYTCMITIIINF